MRQFAELTRLFFGRFLENDLIALDGDTRATVAGLLSLLVAPGIFLPLIEYVRFSSAPLCFLPLEGRDLAAIPDKALAIALSMTVLGLFTIFEWDAVLPDRRDIAVLRPLPVGTGVLFAGKIAALGAFWAVLTAAVNSAPGVLFPMAIVQTDTFGVLLRYIVSQAAAVVGANAFMFLSMIAIQGLLITGLGWTRFRRAAPYAQFALIIVVLAMFFLSTGLAYGLRPGEAPRPLAAALPALWFLGLNQQLLGGGVATFGGLARWALPGIGIAALLAAAGYALSYRRSLSRSFEEQDGPAAKPGRIADALMSAANRTVLGTPAERASFYFVWQTITRSRNHRVLIAAWAGSGCALVLQGIIAAMVAGYQKWWQTPAGPLLPAAIVIPLFLITGLRYASSVPADLRSNWVFQAAACGEPADYLAGARKATLLIGVVPPFMLLAPVYAALWGWRTAGLHVLFSAVIAYLLAEAQLAAMEKVPFTCSYVAGKANLKTCWMLYIFGYLAYVAGLSWLDLGILKQPALLLPFLATAALARAAIGLYRRRASGLQLLYDERPEPVVQALEIEQ